MTKTNPKQKHGKESINNLIDLTKDKSKKEIESNPVIAMLEEQGVF